MARLKTGKRARLPDSAFAYVDSRGRRRLPVHDKAHVRNALARFNQVAFETDAARERARKRLLNAAKKYRIVPVGFITGELRSERRHAAAGRLVIELGRNPAPGELEKRLRTGLRDPTLAVLHWSDVSGAYLDGTGLPVPLPAQGERRGVTYLERQGRPMTALVHDPTILDDPALAETVIDARADEFFAVFERATAAAEAAVAIQRELGTRAWPDDLADSRGEPRVRVGIHSGRPTLTDLGYIGLAVHTTARVCSAAHGGQIVVSAATRVAIGASAPTGIRFRSLGRHRLPGLPDAERLFQVQAQGLRVKFPRPRTGRRQADDRRARSEKPTRPEESQLELPQPPA